MPLGQEITIHPWTKIATDIFYFDGTSYLLIVNYTSRFPVMRKLTSTTAQHVVGQMKLVFSEYEWPETIISDNGPCYLAETFTKLMKDYSVNHVTSSPHYLRSNGLVEKYVQIVKNLFYKAQEERTDLYKSLMIYRNTLLSSSLQSSMQIIQSQTTRSQFPMSNVARKQFGLGPEQLRIKSKNEHLPWHDLQLGQSVMYQDSMTKRWYPATITNLCQEPRSYKVTTKDGIIYRKMQAHLKPYWPQYKDTEINWTIAICELWNLNLTLSKLIANKLDQKETLNPQLSWTYSDL